MARNFASFLLAHDYVSVAELEECTQTTVLFGGRLGTALIELGLITPDALERALSEFYDLPPIPADWIAKPDPAARAALHIDLVKRNRAFPLFFEKRTLHLGMLDPRNEPVLDELAFASGCLIAPHALPEFRFVQLMHRVYGVAPSARFRTLLDENHRARLMRERSRVREVRALERAHETDELAIGPLAADLELTDESSFHLVPTEPTPPAAQRTAGGAKQQAKPAPAAPPSASAPVPKPAAAVSVAELASEPTLEIDEAQPPVTTVPAQSPASSPSIGALERLVRESSERSEVIDASLALASRFGEVAALFVLREGVAAGLCAARAGQPLDVESTLLPLSGDGLVASCARERKPAVGLPAAALDKLLAKALRSDEASELAVFPVAIGERVVNLIVVQAASGPLPRVAAPALGVLAALLGGAYERLIRIQKQKAAAPQTAPAPAPSSPRAPATEEPAPPAAQRTLGALPLRKKIVRADAPDK